MKARADIDSVVAAVASMEPEDHGLTATEHAAATAGADEYQREPRAKWPLRVDGDDATRNMLKMSWGKGRTAKFNVLVRNGEDLGYQQCEDARIIKSGHDVMFRVSLSAFIPSTTYDGQGGKFSVSYTIRSLTLVRRAREPELLEVPQSVMEDDRGVDLDPL